MSCVIPRGECGQRPQVLRDRSYLSHLCPPNSNADDADEAEEKGVSLEFG